MSRQLAGRDGKAEREDKARGREERKREAERKRNKAFYKPRQGSGGSWAMFSAESQLFCP